MQPLTHLIFKAMKDAVIYKKSKYWNWGGTWLNGQEGVYRFKKKFGAVDFKYKYHIYANKDLKSLSDKKIKDISNNLPYYYLRPY